MKRRLALISALSAAGLFAGATALLPAKDHADKVGSPPAPAPVQPAAVQPSAVDKASAATDAPAVPPPGGSTITVLPTLEERITKLERLINQPTPPSAAPKPAEEPAAPPDPTVAAHAATTQPDMTAHLDAPRDVKAAFQQLQARLDTAERRLTVLEQKLRNPVAGDERDDQVRQLSQVIEDARRTSKDLENRVHRLEQRNSH